MPLMSFMAALADQFAVAPKLPPLFKEVFSVTAPLETMPWLPT